MAILSIIIPVYNQEELIKKAINSLPVRDDLEIIVIDDASTDNTVKSVESLERNDIRLITLSTKQSIGYCRNVGLDAAHGEFVFWLDSDDYVYTKEFEDFIDFVYRHKWPDVIHIDFVNNKGRKYRGIDACGTVSKVTKLKTIKKYKVRFEDITVGEDLIFWNDLKEKKIIATYYKKLFYHYNYPRQGSVTWLASHHKIEKDWEKIKR